MDFNWALKALFFSLGWDGSDLVCFLLNSMVWGKFCIVRRHRIDLNASPTLLSKSQSLDAINVVPSTMEACSCRTLKACCDIWA